MKLVEFLTNIANSIRYAEGSKELVPAEEMADRVKVRADVEDGLIDGTATDYVNDRITIIGTSAFHARANLVSASFANANTVSSNAFYRCSNLNTVEFGSVTRIYQNAFYLGYELIALVIKSDSFCALNNSSALTYDTPIAEGKGWIYVPAKLVETYKTLTNWVLFANQIVAIEDYELKIVTQPTDFVGAAGDAVSLEVVVMAIGVKYQWQVSADGGNTWNDSTLSTANSRILSFSMTTAYDGRKARCIIRDKYGDLVVTDAITLTIGENEVAE